PRAGQVLAEALDQKEIRNVAQNITVKIVNTTNSSNGSGVLYSRQGNVYSVLTNQHVLQDSGNYEIITADGQKHVISSQEEIPGLDLMVVQFQTNNNYQTAELGDSEEIAPLQLVYVAGYPAIQADLDIVDGKIRSIRQDVLKNPQDKLGYALVYTNQTLPGSSGGAVLNEQGYLVGINGEAERDLRSGRDVSRGIPINLFISLSINYLPDEQVAEPEKPSSAEITDKDRKREEEERREREREEEERRKREEERREQEREEEERRKREEERQQQEEERREKEEEEYQSNDDKEEDNDNEEFDEQIAYLPTVAGNSNYSLAYNIPQPESEIRSVAITPNGRTIVTGGGDRQIKVWHGQTGSLEQTLSGHEEKIKTVAISADGNTIVSSGNDSQIKIWNRRTGQLERSLETNEEEINSIALSLNGNIIVSGGGDRQIKVWNRWTGKLERTLEGHEEEIKIVAVSADGETIVSGGQDKQVKVWKWRTWELKQTLKSHKEEVRAVAISADGNTIVSGSGDDTIKVWDVSGKLKYTLRGHEDKVDTLVLSNDGHIISGSRDRTIKIWDLQTQTLEQSLETDRSKAINSIAASANQQIIVSGNEDQTLTIWHLK
ncbi:MAG: trypsin-like peptidase domain-containing protein, partial [Cyanobacteria bacterium J06638_38]